MTERFVVHAHRSNVVSSTCPNLHCEKKERRMWDREIRGTKMREGFEL